MENLYANLMALIVPNDFSKFFYKDFVTPFGTTVRIFSYNYASYEDWLKDGALECRGIMFEMKNGEPVRIMSRPMEKFFNLDETPFTQNLDLSTIDHFMSKEDGSLISTYHDNGVLQVKSKGSIRSSQAVESYQIFLDIDHAPLRERCRKLAVDGYTCNFEYVSPTNRIVLAYKEKALILLNVRHNETGEYVPHSELIKDPVLRKYVVGAWSMDDPLNDGYSTPEEMVEQIRGLTTVEGYVFVLESGLRFKLKTHWYSNLHRVKDTINNNEALFEVVVSNGTDDIKSMFDDEFSLNKINQFEKIFIEYLKESIHHLNEFNAEYAGKDRKDYAVNAQINFQKLGKFELFGIAMQLFTGRLDSESMVNEINKVFIKNCKNYIPEEYKVTPVSPE